MTTMGKTDPPFTQEIADGVHAYIQPDGTWFLNNTGIIVGPDTTLMIDQTSTVDRGRALMETVARIGGDKPLSGLVNTHMHGDHTFGNFLVPTHIPIYGHHRARTEMIAGGTAITMFFEGPEWGDIQIRPPDITFDERLTIHVGDRPLELIHFGLPAHTTNDVVAYLPEQKVCFTGDLLFNGGTPFALQGSVVGWLHTIDQLETLDADVWVAGHGPVSDGAEIEVVRGYLELVRDAAEQGLAAGRAPLEVAREVDLGEYAQLSDAERFVGNLHRAYADLTDPEHLGKPLELLPIVGDIRTFNGGPIVSLA